MPVTTRDVKSISKAASAKLKGDVTLSEGANITLTQSGQDIAIAAAAGGSVATDAIWDAKGDLAVGTGANTASKLTIGSNNTVLVADSGESTGAKWSASLSGLTLAAPVITGNCYAEAYNSAAVVLTNASTPYKVTFNTEIFDIGGGYDAGNSKFVCPSGKAGYYHITSKVYIYAYSGSSVCTLFLYKNNASISQHRLYQPSPCMPLVNFVTHLDATDYLEIYASCDTTSGQVYNGGSELGHVSIMQLSQD